MSLVSVTMEGTAENRGVIYRTLEKLFSLSEERSDLMTYEVSVSMLEVYNETIRGLLVKDAKNPANKRSQKEGQRLRVHKTDEVLELLKSGSRARSVGSTNANEFSSRSHWKDRLGLKGKRLEEAKFINRSLWWINFWISKLTLLLKSSLAADASPSLASLANLRRNWFSLAKKAKHDGEGTEKLQEKFCNLESEPAEEPKTRQKQEQKLLLWLLHTPHLLQQKNAA
ncbi:kinesin-like protein KIN-14S [Tanacetum coccineum]